MKINKFLISYISVCINIFKEYHGNIINNYRMYFTNRKKCISLNKTMMQKYKPFKVLKVNTSGLAWRNKQRVYGHISYSLLFQKISSIIPIKFGSLGLKTETLQWEPSERKHEMNTIMKFWMIHYYYYTQPNVVLIYYVVPSKKCVCPFSNSFRMITWETDAWIS